MDKLGEATFAGSCTQEADGDDRSDRSFSYGGGHGFTTVKSAADAAKVTCDMGNGTFTAATPAAAAPQETAAKKKK